MNRPLPAVALLSALCLLTSASALARDDDDVSTSVGVGAGPSGLNMQINIKDNTGRRGQAEVQAKAHEEFSSSKPGESFKIAYDSAEYDKTSFRVLAPEGLLAHVTEGSFPVARDTIPLSFDASAGKFYRIQVFAQGGAVVFDKKLEAKGGMLASLWVSASAPPPPSNVTVVVQAAPPPPPPAAASCLPSGELESIKGAIEEASFSDQKTSVLESAIASRGICGAQVIDVLGLFSFSKDKLQALRLMRPRIVDPQNNYKILGAFTFDGDKKQAKGILGN